jgi:hypothetical protein
LGAPETGSATAAAATVGLGTGKGGTAGLSRGAIWMLILCVVPAAGGLTRFAPAEPSCACAGTANAAHRAAVQRKRFIKLPGFFIFRFFPFSHKDHEKTTIVYETLDNAK